MDYTPLRMKLAKAKIVEIADNITDPYEWGNTQNLNNSKFNVLSSSGFTWWKHQGTGLSSRKLTPDHQENEPKHNWSVQENSHSVEIVIARSNKYESQLQ